MSQFIISPISAQHNKSNTFLGSSFVPAAFPGASISDNNNNLNNNNLSTNNNESKISSFDPGIINQGAVNHQHRLYQHINSKPQDGKPVLRMDNFFKPILNPTKTKHKRTREEQSRGNNLVDNSHNNKHGQRDRESSKHTPDIEEESLFKSFKRCKITRTSGELRLKKDIEDVKLKLTSGHVEILQIPKNPLRFDLIIHRVWPTNTNRVSTSTFLCKVSRFYPHEAPKLY